MSKTEVIILAAGRGSRMQGYNNYPKGLLKVANSQSLISKLTSQILKFSGQAKISIVTGYQSDLIRSELNYFSEQINFIENSEYLNSNNSFSLYLALTEQKLNTSYEQSNLCVIAGDLICDDALFEYYFQEQTKQHNLCLFNSNFTIPNDYNVQIKNGKVTKICDRLPSPSGLYAGSVFLKAIDKISYHDKLNEIIRAGNKDFLYSDILNILLNKNLLDLLPIDCCDFFWHEIDRPQDYLKYLNAN